MWEMGLAKYTPMQVAQYNNDLGIRNNEGNDLDRCVSAGLLSKPRMQRSNRQGRVQESELIPNGEPLAVCENAHQAMVTPEQWDRVDGYIAERHNAPAGPGATAVSTCSAGGYSAGIAHHPCTSARTMTAPSRSFARRRSIKAKPRARSRNPQLKDVLSEVVTALLERVLTKESLNQQVTAVAQENESFLSEQQADREQLQKAQSLAKLQIKIW